MFDEDILKSFNSALRGTKLYPQGHPAIKSSADKTILLMGQLLNDEKNFLIGLVEGAIIFDEDPMPDSERLYSELIAVMREKNLASMIFEHGVKAEELSALIEILTGPPVIEQKLRTTLSASGVTRIAVKFATEDEGNFLEVYNGAIEAVINAMDEVRMGKIPSSGPVNKVTDELAESVLEDRDAMIGLSMIKNYDNYLFNHSVNVAILSVSLAGALGLSKEQIHNTAVGAILHDIGKTGVAEQIIRKPGGLSSEEWQQIKAHPQIGADIIRRMDGMDEVTASIVYEHHIKYDETGYPEEHGKLHPLSQIITICDAYDALTTLRVYQKPHNPAEALKIMTNFSGRTFHPEFLKTFTDMIGIYPVGTLVRLCTNHLGIITKVSAETPSRPVLKLIVDSEGVKISPPIVLDLAEEINEDKSILATVNPASLGIELGEFFKKEAASESN